MEAKTKKAFKRAESLTALLAVLAAWALLGALQRIDTAGAVELLPALGVAALAAVANAFPVAREPRRSLQGAVVLSTLAFVAGLALLPLPAALLAFGAGTVVGALSQDVLPWYRNVLAPVTILAAAAGCLAVLATADALVALTLAPVLIAALGGMVFVVTRQLLLAASVTIIGWLPRRGALFAFLPRPGVEAWQIGLGAGLGLIGGSGQALLAGLAAAAAILTLYRSNVEGRAAARHLEALVDGAHWLRSARHPDVVTEAVQRTVERLFDVDAMRYVDGPCPPDRLRAPTTMPDGRRGWLVVDEITGVGADGPDDDRLAVLHAVGDLAASATENTLLHRGVDSPRGSDGVTGLADQRALEDHLEAAVDRAGSQGGEVVAVFADLDGFHVINEAYGHETGDRLLRVLAKRVQGTAHRAGLVARIGGDQFAVVLEGSASRVDAETVAARIAEALSQPVTLDGRNIGVSANVGVVAFPTDANSWQELLHRAAPDLVDLGMAADPARGGPGERDASSSTGAPATA